MILHIKPASYKQVCKRSILKLCPLIFLEIHTPEKSGCSKSGLINCTSNAYTIRDKIKESLDNDENAKQTDITKICQ